MTDLTLTLTGAAADALRRLTQARGFETPAEAVVALLDESVRADAELDTWLGEVVLARYDASQADPSRKVSLKDARRRLRGGLD